MHIESTTTTRHYAENRLMKVAGFTLKAIHPDTGELCEYKKLLASSEGPECLAACSEEFH